jgi:protein-S-isoprenylcysteine O-methyltransferase Ste14
LARYDQPKHPGFPTSRNVTACVFSVLRNLLYLGTGRTLSVVALGFIILWIVALLIPAVVFCLSVWIAPEERYLINIFGIEYLEYTASVRR